MKTKKSFSNLDEKMFEKIERHMTSSIKGGEDPIQYPPTCTAQDTPCQIVHPTLTIPQCKPAS